MRFVVAPVAMKIPGGVVRAGVGPWRIFEFPDARMKPYPGLDVLEPSRPRSLRKKLLDWFAGAR